MRIRTLLLPSVLAAGGLILFAFVATSIGGRTPDSFVSATGAVDVPPEFFEWERERIRAHLARVEDEMRLRDVSHLTPDQRENRARLLEILAEYRERGVFPKNRDFPGERVPYFVDDEGVRCAVGYLLHRFGRDDVVDHVAASRNHATVPELADEPGLAGWLHDMGITLEEAARIQPMYCGPGGEPGAGCPIDLEPETKPLTGGYLAATAGVVALEGAALSLNLASLLRDEPSGLRGAVALGAGIGGVGLAVHGIRDPGDRRTAGFVHLAVGLATAASGIHALRRLGFEEDNEAGDSFPEGEGLLSRHSGSSARKADSDGARLDLRPLIRHVASDRRIGLALRLRH